jgi:hypothetical protein
MSFPDFFFFLFICTIVTVVFLVLFVLHLAFFRDEEFFIHVFPDKRPTREMFFSKNIDVSHRLTVYYSTRILLFSLIVLGILVFTKKYLIS